MVIEEEGHNAVMTWAVGRNRGTRLEEGNQETTAHIQA